MVRQHAQAYLPRMWRSTKPKGEGPPAPMRRRHAVELLADLFADALEGLAAGAVGRVDLVVMIYAWQARGQRLANRLALGTRRPGRWLGLLRCSAVLEQGVGHDGVEQH